MPLELQHICGNIVKQEADFLVNASNTKLMLGSGVSMAFRRHCGLGLQQEMDVVRAEILAGGGDVQQGDVLQTSSAAASNCSYVLHAAVMKYGKGVRQHEKAPTLATIEAILVHCLPYLEYFSCNTDQKVTIAFPYLGCGIGGLKKTDVLRVFEKFVAKPCSLDAVIQLCDSLGSKSSPEYAPKDLQDPSRVTQL